MAEPIWELKFKGEPVSIAFDDLTRHRMRELRANLGDEYGIPSFFMAKLNLGDYEAIAGALWIHGQVSGKPIKNMNELDFCESDFSAPDPKPKPPRKKPDPKAEATSGETNSPETPKNSETSSSS